MPDAKGEGWVMNAGAGMCIIIFFSSWTIVLSVMLGYSITPRVIGQYVVDRLEKFVEDHGGG